MNFKLAYTARRLDVIGPEDGLVVELPGIPPATVVIRAPNRDERSRGHKSFNAFVDAFCESKPTKRSKPSLDAVIEGRRPPEDAKARTADELVHHKGPSVGLENYPDAFQSYIDSVRSVLHDSVCRLVDIIRWRYAQEGPPDPISVRGFYVSEDGATWTSIPGRYGVTVVTPPSSRLNVDKVDTDELRSLYSRDLREPLAHELLREAKELRHTSPRSSVLLAVTAMEVGIKATIGEAVPGSRWLVDSLQSPPIVRILSEYLPSLFDTAGEYYSSDRRKNPLRTVEGAVACRNALVHQGATPPSNDRIGEFLDCASQVLWICDALLGHRWVHSLATSRGQHVAGARG